MSPALDARLNALCDRFPFRIGWYLKDLRSGRVASRHGDAVVASASVRKIAIMMAALQCVHKGKLALEQPVTMEAKYQIDDSGCFQHFTPGFTITLRDAIIMMIIVSDNTAAGTVADLVGLDAINALCEAIGMRNTVHRYGIPPIEMIGDEAAHETNQTSPADVGLLLELIVNGASDPASAARLGSTPALCRLALEILSWQRVNDRLPALLPFGTRVAHKTGNRGSNPSDAGIVFDGDVPLFVLVAYVDDVPSELADGAAGHAAATGLIAALSRTCFEALR